jgi:transcriptional regulator with XRE-family HTH domain
MMKPTLRRGFFFALEEGSGMDLKATRERLGLSQAELGKPIGKSQSTISYVEAGVIDLELEDMVILERVLGTKIDWPESLPICEKFQALQALTSLADGYPLRVVLRFGEKALGDSRDNAPAKKISLYAQAAQNDVGLLLPSGVS